MKPKRIRKALAYGLCVSLLTGICMAGAVVSADDDRTADITITYDGSQTLETSTDDFFGEAGKNLMPGASFDKLVDVVNRSGSSIIVYLKAEVNEAVYADYVARHPVADEVTQKRYVEQLIQELGMTITALDPQGVPQQVYYQGPASGDPQDADPQDTDPGLTTRQPNSEHGIVIGRLSGRATAQLTFDVQIPLSLGNEYQDTMSLVKWTLVCYAEDELIDDDDPPLVEPTKPSEIIVDDDIPLIDGPVTGEDTSLWATVLMLAGASFTVCLLLVLLGKRKKKNTEA